jgi:hypothetical protein
MVGLRKITEFIAILYASLVYLGTRVYWKIFGYIRIEYNYKSRINAVELNENISFAIDNSIPYFFARFGETEFRAIWQTLELKYKIRRRYSLNLIRDLEKLAGVFPTNDNFIHAFSNEYTNSIKKANVVGTWLDYREKALVNLLFNSIDVCGLNDVEPFFLQKPWTKSLDGKNVLVIHSFTNSIHSQITKLNKIVVGNMVLENINYTIIKPPLTTIESGRRSDNWLMELELLKKEVDSLDYDVALISCGSYGIPISSYIFSKGKVVLYLGGVLQLFFAIKGGRWEKDPKYNKLINDDWIKPNLADINIEFMNNFNEFEKSGGYW